MSTAFDIQDDLGRRLRDYRERHVLTQAELAAKLKIPPRSLQDYESGLSLPRQARRRKILAFLAREMERAA